MALTIPSTDAQSTALNGAITAIGTQISNVGTSNGALAQKLAADKVQAQHNLVLHLLGSGHISAATILAGSGVTYLNGPAIS